MLPNTAKKERGHTESGRSAADGGLGRESACHALAVSLDGGGADSCDSGSENGEDGEELHF